MQAIDGFPDAERNALRAFEVCRKAKADLVRQAAQTDAAYRLEGQAAAGVCEAVASGLTAKELVETDPVKLAEIRGRIARMKELSAQFSEFRMMGG